MSTQRLLLGSASLRRRKILAEAGVPFDAVAADVAEDADGAPAFVAAAHARAKYDACRTQYPARTILTADTVIDLDGACIPKPASLEQAIDFFRRFSGRSHTVLTAVAFGTAEQPLREAVIPSTVVFRSLDDARIRTYFARVDPLDKAGAYDIDQHADLIVERYEGSYTNIMGLPIETVLPWLRAAGCVP